MTTKRSSENLGPHWLPFGGGSHSGLRGHWSHSTFSRSFRKRLFPGNQLHWCWYRKSDEIKLAPRNQKIIRKSRPI